MLEDKIVDAFIPKEHARRGQTRLEMEKLKGLPEERNRLRTMRLELDQGARASFSEAEVVAAGLDTTQTEPGDAWLGSATLSGGNGRGRYNDQSK